jgi:hypothetical protein
MSKLPWMLAAASALLIPTLQSGAATVVSTGGALDCSGAAASRGVIWPPDHSMVAESIIGVTDAPGIVPTITITGIQQDEPVEVDGSGNTEPDGSGVGTSMAYVRAERAGPGTGRIYFIAFSATDSLGNSCTNEVVRVFVPHDQGQGFAPADTGARYDSTLAVD